MKTGKVEQVAYFKGKSGVNGKMVMSYKKHYVN
jgi:hypothetical protein